MESGRISVYWLGQSGFVIDFLDDAAGRRSRVMLDPYVSNRVKRLDGFTRLQPVPAPLDRFDPDTVLISHVHADHLDPLAVQILTFSSDALFVGPPSVVEELRRRHIPPHRIVQVTPGESVRIVDTEITAIDADHTVESVGFLITGNGFTVYFTGDSRYSERFRQALKLVDRVDVLIGCINGPGFNNLSPDDLASVVEELRPRIVIPMHYGMFAENTGDPRRLATHHRVLETGAKVMILELGEWTTIPVE